jgi:hypothetical protein
MVRETMRAKRDSAREVRFTNYRAQQSKKSRQAIPQTRHAKYQLNKTQKEPPF